MDFALSVRTINCLKAADILTLEDLLVSRKSDLMRYRNFGKKSLDELCDWLEDNYNWQLIH
jgi:DNA-directed RNA polymerase subunit alpha